jgi:hypothetical protein
MGSYLHGLSKSCREVLQAYLPDRQPRTAACGLSVRSVAWYGQLDMYIVFSLPAAGCWPLRPELPAVSLGLSAISFLCLFEDAGLQDFIHSHARQNLLLICCHRYEIMELYLYINIAVNFSTLCLAPVVARQVVPPLHVSYILGEVATAPAQGGLQ